jgi:hypothetical protein
MTARKPDAHRRTLSGPAIGLFNWVRLIVAEFRDGKGPVRGAYCCMAYRLAVKRRGRRPATPFKWEIYEDDGLVEQSLEYFATKGKAVESGIKALMRLRNLKAREREYHD